MHAFGNKWETMIVGNTFSVESEPEALALETQFDHIEALEHVLSRCTRLSFQTTQSTHPCLDVRGPMAWINACNACIELAGLQPEK